MGYMYILHCANGQYYTGSTKSLYRRFRQHQRGEGANFTRKHLPVQLLYYEVYHRIDWAFYREKQIQGWSRKKKEALMRGEYGALQQFAECQNESHYLRQRYRRVPNHGALRLRSVHRDSEHDDVPVRSVHRDSEHDDARNSLPSSKDIRPIRVQRGIRTQEMAVAVISMEELLEQLSPKE